MKYFIFFLLSAGLALGEGIPEATNKVVVVNSLAQTNDLEAAEAVESMTVKENEASTKETQVAEAEEVAEIARQAEVREEEQPVKNVDPWGAFAPPADSKFDWLQLTSGEWLKGDFKVMYDFTVEFDSDEMGLHTFDFDDVKQVRTRAMKSVFLEGENDPRDTSVLRGVLVIEGDQVTLIRSEHEVSIPREKVISIAGGKQRERDYWSGMASIGLNMRGGNTETVDATVIANLKRRTAQTRFNTDYLANYSKTKKVDTAENQRLSGYFDWFFTGRFYWQVLDLEYYRDPFSNIGGQYSVSTGVGYDLMRTSRTEWTINTGLGRQTLRFESVQPGDSPSSDSFFFTAGTKFDYELTDDIDLLYDYSMRLLNTENGEYTHHMLGTISFDVLGDLDLDFSIIWDHISKPTPLNAAGIITTPEQDDYQLIVSLAYDF